MRPVEPEGVQRPGSAARSRAASQFAAVPIHHLQTDDAAVAFRRFGRGPVLLMIHGFPLHGFTWRHVIPALSERYTCVVVDQAGSGASRWSALTDFGFHAHARRLKALVDHLGVSHYGVVAHDTGATVARLLGVIDDRLTRMVLINTEMPGHRPPWIPQYQVLMAAPGATWLYRQLLRSSFYLQSRMTFGGCFVDLSLIDGDFHDAFIAPCIASAAITDGLMRCLRGIDWAVVDDLAACHRQLKMPVRLLWGVDDPTFPIDRARDMALQFHQKAELVPVAGTRLLPHEERPAFVSEAIIEFFQ